MLAVFISCSPTAAEKPDTALVKYNNMCVVI